MQKSILFVLMAFAPFLSLAFTGQGLARSFVSKSSLSLGPLQKLANKGDYNKIVEGLMQTKGYTREQAEKEYNAYLDNPNDYALQKGEAYYKSLGYKTLLEGVIGEAEKEGKGDEVKARIEEFKQQSQLKGLATITFFIAVFFYVKIFYLPPIVPN